MLPCDLAGPERKFGLDNFCFYVCQPLAVQHTFPSDREGLKRENVHSTIGERLADFSERARPILH